MREQEVTEVSVEEILQKKSTIVYIDKEGNVGTEVGVTSQDIAKKYVCAFMIQDGTIDSIGATKVGEGEETPGEIEGGIPDYGKEYLFRVHVYNGLFYEAKGVYRGEVDLKNENDDTETYLLFVAQDGSMVLAFVDDIWLVAEVTHDV
jgi:hypothetical protein